MPPSFCVLPRPSVSFPVLAALTLLALALSAAAADPAFDRLQAEAASGSADARFRLGRAFERGEGTARDEAAAVRWYRAAAEQGDLRAQYNLALCLLEARGTARDSVEGERWLARAAAQGNAEVAANYGGRLARGLGLPKNPTAALPWLRQAAEAGVMRAQLGLAELFYFGDEGIPRDYVEASRWALRAAAQDNAAAQNLLGVLHEHGLGVERQPELAFRYFRQAARAGHVRAQGNLGRLYFHGEGTGKDLVEARRWLQLAAEKEDMEALQYLPAVEAELAELASVRRSEPEQRPTNGLTRSHEDTKRE